MPVIAPRTPSHTRLRPTDHGHFPAVAAALEATAEESPLAVTLVTDLHTAAAEWLRANDHEGVPLGAFRRFIIALGYYSVRQESGKENEIHGLAIRQR